MRKTKIIATIGSATRSDEKIDQLVQAGVDVVRLNFSHGTAAEHAAAVTAVRRAAQHHARAVAILQDLQGAKIRTGALKDDKPVELTAGQALIITTEACAGTAIWCASAAGACRRRRVRRMQSLRLHARSQKNRLWRPSAFSLFPERPRD